MSAAAGHSISGVVPSSGSCVVVSLVFKILKSTQMYGIEMMPHEASLDISDKANNNLHLEQRNDKENQSSENKLNNQFRQPPDYKKFFLEGLKVFQEERKQILLMIKKLRKLGFTSRDSQRALRVSGGNYARAKELLLARLRLNGSCSTPPLPRRKPLSSAAIERKPFG